MTVAGQLYGRDVPYRLMKSILLHAITAYNGVTEWLTISSLRGLFRTPPSASNIFQTW
jgi:hypothetical protein